MSRIIASLLGDDVLLSTLSGNIAKPGGIEMGLHTDQWWMPRPNPAGGPHQVAGNIRRGAYFGPPTDDPEGAEFTPGGVQGYVLP
ncbi:MAG: hypothetical protein AAF493_13335 [Pseudomonadota bacterium]